MDKEAFRKYLEKIFDYLNVSSICYLYNKENPNDKIDYNNLRTFVKNKKYDKLSLKKLEKMVYFIKQRVGVNLILEENKEKHIIEKSKKELKKELIEVIREFKEKKNGV